MTLICFGDQNLSSSRQHSLPFAAYHSRCSQEIMSSELRAKLQGLLGVRCVFPNNSGATDSDFTVRCMLENSSGGKALLYKDSIEDVIVRLKSLTSIENDEDRAIRIKVCLSKYVQYKFKFSHRRFPTFLPRKSNICSRDSSPMCKSSLVCQLPRQFR